MVSHKTARDQLRFLTCSLSRFTQEARWFWTFGQMYTVTELHPCVYLQPHFGERSITRVHKNTSTHRLRVALLYGLGLAKYSRYIE